MTIVAQYELAEELFADGCQNSKIAACYIYSSNQRIAPAWTQQYPVIRGVFSDMNSLYDQLASDLQSTNQALPLTDEVSCHRLIDS